MVEKSKYYVSEIVRPNYLTGKVEREKYAPPKDKTKKSKPKKEKKSILSKTLKQKLQSKSILKKSKKSVTIPDYKAPSVLGDENRFFKGTMEQTKKEMFFS